MQCDLLLWLKEREGSLCLWLLYESIFLKEEEELFWPSPKLLLIEKNLKMTFILYYNLWHTKTEAKGWNAKESDQIL